MSEHSLLSASASDRWAACPISVQGADSPSGEAAAEGTLGHSLAEAALRGGAYPATGAVMSVDGFDFMISDGLLEDIDAYVKHIRAVPWINGYTVEGRVNYSRALGVPFNQAFGTADCWGFSQGPEGRCLEVVDLKMGRSPVNPTENSQMALYAAGVLDGMYPNLVLPREHKVRLTIFQPRLSYRPFRWTTTVEWIEQTAYMMRPAAHAAIAYRSRTATAETAQMFPEMPGSHCRYCGRKPQCQTFQHKMALAAQPGGTVKWDAKLFEMREAIVAYLKDMEALAKDAALAGNPYPGTKLVQGRAGNPVLQVPREQVREIAKKLGMEEAVVKLEEVWATPAKIRDAFKRHGVQPAELLQIVQSPEGAPLLALAADPRPEVKRGADATAFGGVPMPR